jgi:hypothetical protein
MPDLIKQDNQALDWITENPQDQRTPAIMQKLGIDEQSVAAWKYAKENPSDKRAIPLRNKVYNQIAEKRPAADSQGVSDMDRFLIKNLVDNEPKVQEEYLKRKGFETRLINNEVEVKKPGDTEFKKIDPSGFDLFDVTDLAGDVIEGVAGAVTTGAKALGLIGAPATGGASLAAASGIGGLVSGGLETARQVAGKQLGLRDEINKSKIAQNTAIGLAMPGAGKLLSKVSEGAGFLINKIRGLDDIKLRPDSEAVKEAAKKIGAAPTPGQLFEHRYVQQLEESLRQSEGTFGGWQVRRAMRQNVKASKDAANAIVEAASKKTDFNSGALAKDQLKEEFAEIIKPAEAIYDKYESLFKNSDLKPNLLKIKTAIQNGKADILDPDAQSVLKQVEKNFLPRIKNLDSLKQIRTLVGENMRSTNNPAAKKALGQVYGALTEVRSDTLKKGGEKYGASDIAKTIADDIETADFLYRGAAEQLEATIFTGGKKVKGGLKGALDGFLNKTKEIELINKVLVENDPKKIAYVKEIFPKAFETLRTAKIADIAKAAETKGEVSARKLVNAIDGMPPETGSLIFGQHAMEKVGALKKFLDSIPGKEVLGPSGSPEGIFFQIMGQIRQLKSASNSMRLSSAQRVALEKDVFSRASKLLGSQAARAGGIIGARQLTNDGQDKSQFNKLKIPQDGGGGLQIPVGE